MIKYGLLVLLTLISTISSTVTAQQAPSIASSNIKPKIQHGITYQAVADISLYYVSEKLDGVRGYWDGEQLLTRQGNPINSPRWFTQHWPPFPIDGELWLERGKFQTLLSCVSKHSAEENKTLSCWREVRFMMFDLPTHQGDFHARVNQMQHLLRQAPSPYLAMIKQVRFTKLAALDKKLDDVIANRGEGLMLHLASAHYQIGRNSALMKLKKHQDAEATVIGYTKGKGKYQNQLGAIEVKTSKGIIFKIGSGFNDYQRTHPPKIGSVITFKYNGLTDAGIPRFARFWRIKSTK
jgi:DNA ligase-1